MLVLGIESSCDETSAAVVSDGARILSNVVASQIALHRPYGGVVPELASRHHLELINTVVTDALREAGVTLDQIEGVAATCGPGLASSLLIGLTFGKALALARNLPFIGINHMEAHLISPWLSAGRAFEPNVSLIVSGGHTMLVHVRAISDHTVLGQTTDDAAGEAFDKVAKLLGLGYPGGPEVEKAAHDGNPTAIPFPRGKLNDPDFDFSFSGIKTSVLYWLRKWEQKEMADGRWQMAASGSPPSAFDAPRPTLPAQTLNDLCASFQQAVVDVLVGKAIAAALAMRVRFVTVSGGVACNGALRDQLAAACRRHGIELLMADRKLCTDNAGMIAGLGWHKLQAGLRSPLDLDAQPNLRLG
ncbi:MAG: tRNA (adenosine(37)-N6)-threonylcarbamoyltransferase complex transferase subunit TsaD [Verrucomicrobia bacterium]|nr:tRNA (adenosine(37)-N6)-threonylcarbamoyltransferase complex transferase subunit TsaD [Verrucomicrobiota bacterium]MCX6908513.1 tRNA (adenosine(37)-N6)-threonylcarbamoyltransferase complex transferase subunit TsaD [Verrucomicrobiota bacterium]